MMKGACLGNIAIDCKDAQKLRDFYADLLGWEAGEMYEIPSVSGQNGIVFLFMAEDDYEYIPPVWPEQPGKQQKQIHFDFQVDDLPSAVTYAKTIGAVKAEIQFGGDDWVTMFDPEGHPFCLCAK
jgi:catechol 2,3-dioxygenase-like lactoylglutathione lyase family enzyme